jgi:heme-degrading monooxygenase HmoA
MITRLWHGRTSLEHAPYYLEFLLNAGTKEYKETPGNISIKIWTKKDKDCCHFYTVTEWEDLDAVKRFAGEDFEEAVYYPEDQGILLEFEEKVTHFETFAIAK